MRKNEELIAHFYESFKKKSYKDMQECYADNAVFNDEVFKNLNASQVKAMWEMLIKSGKDLQIEYKNIKANDSEGSAEWIATYTFSTTGRKVVNHIKASFLFKDGKIVQHTDHFNFYSWARQALGFSGLLLGWSGFLRKKVQYTAGGKLYAYQEKTNSKSF